MKGIHLMARNPQEVMESLLIASALIGSGYYGFSTVIRNIKGMTGFFLEIRDQLKENSRKIDSIQSEVTDISGKVERIEDRQNKMESFIEFCRGSEPRATFKQWDKHHNE